MSPRKVRLTGPEWSPELQGLVLDAVFVQNDGDESDSEVTWYRTVDENPHLDYWYVNVSDPDDYFGGELLDESAVPA